MQAEIQLSLFEPLIQPLVPAGNRACVDILWRLETRLSELCFAGKEPALRQIRLAWWRDALAALDAPNRRVPDEPLLRDVAAMLLPILSGAQLAAHAEAKLAALSTDWATDDVMAAGQSLFVLMAPLLGSTARCHGGAAYMLTATALAVEDGADRARLLRAAAALPLTSGQPRALAVLDRLARRIACHGGRRSRVSEQALILRVGLFGR